MKQKILRLLRENSDRFISGEEISSILQVSRTAIWKHINSLRDGGYVIESVSGQGYRLLDYPDAINKEELMLKKETEVFGREIHVFEKVVSTNDVARKLAAQGAPEGTIVIAEQQMQGKGRMGRSWVSTPQKGIWFSFVLRPKIMPAFAAQLIFVSAVAVCRALRRSTGLEITIKWPNDLILEGKKIVGILTELSAEIDMVNYLVVGVGINANHRPEDFPAAIREKAGSLALAAGRSFRRTDLLLQVLKELEAEYREYHEAGFSNVIERWKALNSTLGKEVMVISGDEKFSGWAYNLDESGRLLVQREDGSVSAVIAGDVSVRAKEGNYI